METDNASVTQPVKKANLKIGEPFNPSRDACRALGATDDKGNGIYPPDIVGRQKTLSDGPKRLYERLVRWAGGKGECWYSHGTIAEELGKSDRQIRKDIVSLESAALIAHRKRDRRRSNTYIFLWHIWFERNWSSGQNHPVDGLSGTGVPVKTPSDDLKVPVASGTGVPVKTDLSGTGVPPNLVSIEFSKKESSSSEAAAGPETPDDDEPAFERETENPSEPAAPSSTPDQGQNPSVEKKSQNNLETAAWTESQREDARDWLKDYYERSSGRRENGEQATKPDLDITTRILSACDGPADFVGYAWDRERNLQRNIKNYAWFVTDITKFWPGKRAEVLQQYEQKIADEAEFQRRQAVERVERTERDIEEQRKRERTQRHAAIPDCPHCKRSGVVRNRHEDAPDTFSWCTCGHVEFAAYNPEEKTRRHAEEWPSEYERRRLARQSDRWNPHYKRHYNAGLTDDFRSLDREFCVADLDRRDEILEQLDAETEERRPITATEEWKRGVA